MRKWATNTAPGPSKSAPGHSKWTTCATHLNSKGNLLVPLNLSFYFFLPLLKTRFQIPIDHVLKTRFENPNRATLSRTC